MDLNKIQYESLNARQKETYNFHKVAAILADYGYTSIRLSDDWEGADFIAVHIDGSTTLRVQLKGRLSFSKKYVGKGLYIAFPHRGGWYLYPHDELLQIILEKKSFGLSQSWSVKGDYSFPTLSVELIQLLEPYRIEK
jgi:hypothetical protein